jgi:hypothetical protein
MRIRTYITPIVVEVSCVEVLVGVEEARNPLYVLPVHQSE